MSISQVKADAKLRDMQQVARNVYSVVPVQSPMRVSLIHAEYSRSGRNIDSNVLKGCLHALREAGLIKESSHGFVRVAIRNDTKPKPQPVIGNEIKPTTKSDAPMETLPERLRRAANQALEFSTTLETLAHECQAMMDGHAEKQDDFKQLQRLMKSLAGDA